LDENEGIPDYAASLASYHAAFAPELREMIEALPIGRGARVLDVACGDGTYSRLLAGRVGEEGSVWGIDLAPDYLDLASRQGRTGPSPDRVRYAVADLARLPFATGTFDLAWCAQSFYSLPDPVAALRALAALVRPGGVVAVLESDTLHQVLLPWPIDVELALRSAELLGFVRDSNQPRKFYVGRRLRTLFEAAGLRDVRRRCWSIVRSAPLDACTRLFLVGYLHELERRCAADLGPELARKVRPYLDPDSESYLPDRGDLDLTVVEHVVWASCSNP
jgi:ubiquinone/menaquinone biosynthesis C-methylase UbiE